MSHPDSTHVPENEHLEKMIDQGDHLHDARKEDTHLLGSTRPDKKIIREAAERANEDQRIMVVPSVKAIMGSTWCVKCWPDTEYASFIKNGDSVCEKHL